MRTRGRIRIEDLMIGNGTLAERGMVVEIRYTGRVNRGDLFQENQTVTFRIGSRTVIAGLDYGVEGMRVGGLRRIHVPPHLGYREQGAPGLPPNAKFVLDVELLNAEEPSA